MKNPNFDYTELKARSERYGTTTIIGRKSQFKGNTVNVYTVEQDEIVVTNSYYTGHVRQTYSIKNNITTIEYNIDGGYNVKWLEKKFNKLYTDLHIKNKLGGLRAEVLMSSGIICGFGNYHYNLEHKKEIKGLMFQGNIDSIKELKELRYILGGVRKIIKRVDLAELVKHQMDHSTGEMVLIAKLDTKGDHGDRILIDYAKLQQFDKRMSDRS